MDKDLKNLLNNTDFNQIKGLKETHINILNEIKNSLIKNERLYEQGWINIYNRNFTNKRKYGLLNSINLSIISNREKYKSSEWMTFAQMKKINSKLKENEQIKLKKGAKGAKIVFCSIYNKLEKRNITEKEYCKIPIEQRIEMEKKGDLYFYYKEATAFNLDCFENIPENMIYKEKHKRIDVDYNLIKSLCDEINLKIHFEKQNRAYYSHTHDSITMPSLEQWKNDNFFKATFFHELSHATAHKTRLNRDVSFDEKNYAIEEIIAETSSAFLGSKFNYKTEFNINRTASYIDGYAKILIETPKAILNAITKASSVANYIEEVYEKVKIKEREKEMENIKNNEKELPDFSNEPPLFKYQMLSRLQMDCEYFLGYGDRDESKLWAKDVDRQIKLMKNIYNSLEEKPEWIDLEKIENLKYEMKKDFGEYNLEKEKIISELKKYQTELKFLKDDFRNNKEKNIQKLLKKEKNKELER